MGESDESECVTWPWVKRMRQPWLFVYYAVAFGGLSYLLQGDGVLWSVWGGLGFAVLMSLHREFRQRRSRVRAGS